MTRALALVTFLVRDYDEAIEFFCRALNFQLIEDRPVTPAKRWVVVAPSTGAGASLLLAKAVGAEQVAQIGRQGGGRVSFFLQTDDFRADLEHMRQEGVELLEEPREEPYGQVVVFRDLYGNKWDLLQPA